MEQQQADRTKHVAGWVSLFAAIVIAFAGAGEVVVKATSGSPTVILSLVGSFLGFAAACFGLASYDKVVSSRVAIAQLGQASAVELRAKVAQAVVEPAVNDPTS